VVGAETKEIRINLDDGWFRMMYVAKFPGASTNSVFSPVL